MDVREAIQSRRSIRKFKQQSIEKEKIQLILDSGRLAPTGHNTQPGRYIVVDDPHQIGKIAAACNHQPFVAKAPLLIVLLGDLSCRVKGMDEGADVLDAQFSGPREKIIRDAAIVGDHLALQAQELGLGVCWVGDYEQLPMRQALQSPPSHYIVVIFAMGYPDEDPSPRPRRPLNELVYHNVYGQVENS